ncbi:MAG: hypothetical protein K0U74_04390 [Alphaproteobacteria bacterium]|nr:hypothetical protein [Alphaproteobacteria bacterium]
MFRPMVRQVELRARRLQDMMKALGVNELALVREDNGEAYSKARDVCLHCALATDCLHWLEAHDRADPNAGQPEFCPSFKLFERCKA